MHQQPQLCTHYTLYMCAVSVVDSIPSLCLHFIHWSFNHESVHSTFSLYSAAKRVCLFSICMLNLDSLSIISVCALSPFIKSSCHQPASPSDHQSTFLAELVFSAPSNLDPWNVTIPVLKTLWNVPPGVNPPLRWGHTSNRDTLIGPKVGQIRGSPL